MSAAGLPELPDAPVKKGGGTDLPDAPKKGSGAGSPHDFTKGYKPTSQDLATKKSFDDQENSFDKPNGNPSPVSAIGEKTEKKLSQKEQDQATLKDMHDKVTVADAYNKLPGQIKQQVDQIHQYQAQKPKDLLRAATPDEIKQQKFMDNTLGKVIKSVGYISDQADQGAYDLVARGGSWVLNHMSDAVIPGSSITNPIISDKLLDEGSKGLDKLSGITPGQKAQIEGGSGTGWGSVRTLGMLANLAPAIAGGEVTELPRTMFALQGIGQGQKTMYDIDPDHKLNPMVRDAFIIGNGALNGLILGDKDIGLFGKATADTQDKIMNGIVADALKETVDKDLTQQGFKDVLEQKGDKFINNLNKLGANYVESTAKAGVDFAVLNAGQDVLKGGVDLSSDKPVFNQTLGGAMQDISDAVLKQAPLFGLIGLAHGTDVEKQKYDLGKQIGDLDEKIKSYSEKTDDPVRNAENEVNLEHAKKDREELNTNLKQLIVKQNENKKEKVSNGSPIDEVRSEGQESLDGRQVAERPEETDNGSQGVTSPQETDEKRDGVTQSGEASAEPDLKRQKAIDAVTHGVVASDSHLFDPASSARFDFGMPTSDIEKAVRDIKKGNYETAPAKKMLAKLQEWEENDNYPIIEGTGGHSVRNRGATSKDIQENIDDAKANKLGELSQRQIEEVNKPLAELGFTHKDFEDYENHRRATESVANNVQQPENDGKTSNSQNTSGEVAQSGEGGKVNATQKKQIEKGGGGEHQEGDESRKTPTSGGGDSAVSTKEVKKTILTKRAYEGTVSEDVKKHLEEKGLTRKSFSPQERSKQATQFIDKFGEDAARLAVETGDIDGGLATSVLAQLQIRNAEKVEDLPEGSDEREELVKKHAELIALMEKKGYFAGEFVGQLAHEYQNKGLNFASIKRQIEKATKKPLTPEQTKKIKEVTAENERLKAELADLDKKVIQATDEAFKAGVEEAKNETKTQKAKRIANKVRAAKIHRPGIFSAATPASLAWDGAVEVVAKSIETGGKVADAIQAGIDHIKSTDWYKGLSDSKKAEAEREFKLAHNDSAGSTDLGDLQARFVDKKGNKFTPSEARDIWGYVKQTYLNNGTPYRDAISKSAQDLGLTWRQVSEAIVTPKTKRITNELWKKQYDSNRYRQAIKRWVGGQTGSPLTKLYKDVSGTFRGIQVFGHGALFPGTHAGMTLFDAPNTPKTVKAFFNGYKFAYGNLGKFQQAMEELKSDHNYLIAQRAGLKNDPDRLDAEEYQKSQQYLEKIGMGKVAHSGERGFNTIKILRQQLFNYEFDKLPADLRDDPEVAKSIANLANLATGATTVKLSPTIQEATFAGGMEVARWQKLLQSPVKAATTAVKAIVNPESVTPADRVFAKVWARRVGTEIAVYMAARGLNAAINNYINPNKKEDVFNPTDPNWWKFKFAGEDIDPSSGMRGTAKFMQDIGKIATTDTKGIDRVKELGKQTAQYGKGKVSPFVTDLLEIFSRRDFSGNVVPWSNEEPTGSHHKMTPLEYTWSKLPLPAAEAAEATYKAATESGANKIQTKDVMKGLMAGALSGATGFRVGEGSTTVKQTDFDKKMSTVSLTDDQGLNKKVNLTPSQVNKRNEVYHDLDKKERPAFDKLYETEYNLPKNKEKRADRRALWKGKGLSDEWIKNREAQLKKDDKEKYIEEKLVKISGEMMLPDVLKTKEKNKFSIK